MHATRILISLLILTSLAVDLALIGLLPDHSRWPAVLLAVLLGLAGGQINLATVWGVLGYRHVPWRVAGLLVTPTGWSLAVILCAPEMMPAYRTAAAWGVYFLTQTAVLVSILCLVRLFGARWFHTDLVSGVQPTRRPQFTLRYLFAWLTATAIVLSLLKTTFGNARITQSLPDWDAVLILGVINAMLGLSGMWLIVDTRSPPRRWAAASVTALPAACLISWVIFVAAPDRLFAVILLWFITGFYSAVAWTVFRVAGLRLVWLGSKYGELAPIPPEWRESRRTVL